MTATRRTNLAPSFARLKHASLRLSRRVAARLTQHLDRLERDLIFLIEHFPRSQWPGLLRRYHQRHMWLLHQDFLRQMRAVKAWTENRVAAILSRVQPVRVQEEGKLRKLAFAAVAGGLLLALVSKVDPLVQVIKNGNPIPLVKAAIEGLMKRVKNSVELVVRNSTSKAGTESVLSMGRMLGCAGFRVYSVLIPTTREQHWDRHLTGYYFEPGPGQRPISECPQPPYEANGKLAHNCLCWLVPIW